MMSRRLFSLLLLAGLAGCQINSISDVDFYDTSRVNPDKFVEQTRPVWDRPVVVEKVVVRKAVVENVEIEPVVVQADFPVSSPLSSLALKAYGPVDDAGHWLPAIPVGDVPDQFLRREVNYAGREPVGTIVVDTASRHLYLVLGNGRAMRYGVGIGRMGYAWKGVGRIQYQKSWPRWTPSEAYVADRPAMKIFSASYGGLVGGINNPLGARALYIFQGGKDTLYRIHGTPDWKSVGKQVSSGCIRMFNQDVIDLAGRVRAGATIIVR